MFQNREWDLEGPRYYDYNITNNTDMAFLIATYNYYSLFMSFHYSLMIYKSISIKIRYAELTRTYIDFSRYITNTITSNYSTVTN